MWSPILYDKLIAETRFFFSYFDGGDRISYMSIRQKNFLFEYGLYTLLFFLISLLMLAASKSFMVKTIPVGRSSYSWSNEQRFMGIFISATSIALMGFLFMNALVRLNTNVSAFIFCFAFCITLTLTLIFYFKEKSNHAKNKLQALVNEQLKKELEISNVSLLKNELEPHFIFNSLIALNHLISTNPDSATKFNYNLAFVYKYFLLNKNKNFISLDKELELVEKYFYLIQIRFENMIAFNINMDQVDLNKILVIPCTLQILIENAIKHNSFDCKNPLKIELQCKNNFLIITNNLKTKPLQIASTGIGLKNVITRYELIAKKYVHIHNDKTQFVVKVPIIKQEQL